MLLLQISSLMWDYDHNTLPKALKGYFREVNLIHHYETRMASEGKLSIQKFNTNYYGSKSLRIQGSKILNDLKDWEIYTTAKHKIEFINRIKRCMFERYT